MRKAKAFISVLCALAMILTLMPAHVAEAETGGVGGYPIKRIEITLGTAEDGQQPFVVTLTGKEELEEPVEVAAVFLYIQKKDTTLVKTIMKKGPYTVDEPCVVNDFVIETANLALDEYVVTAIAQDSEGKPMSNAFPVFLTFGEEQPEPGAPEPEPSETPQPSETPNTSEGEQPDAPLTGNYVDHKPTTYYLTKDIALYKDPGLKNVLCKITKGTIITVYGRLSTDAVLYVKVGNTAGYVDAHEFKGTYEQTPYYTYYKELDQQKIIDEVLTQLEKNAENIAGNELRRQVVLTAITIVGKVPYFYGGKYYGLLHPEWGKDKKAIVDNTGSEDTWPQDAKLAEYAPYGLDCSGYVQWVYLNAQKALGVSKPKFRGGTWTQWDDSTMLLGGKTIAQYGFKEADGTPSLLIGDLVYRDKPQNCKQGYSNYNGIVVGYADDGTPYVASCTSRIGGVVVEKLDTSSFKYARRPNIYKTFNKIGKADTTPVVSIDRPSAAQIEELLGTEPAVVISSSLNVVTVEMSDAFAIIMPETNRSTYKVASSEGLTLLGDKVFKPENADGTKPYYHVFLFKSSALGEHNVVFNRLDANKQVVNGETYTFKIKTIEDKPEPQPEPEPTPTPEPSETPEPSPTESPESPEGTPEPSESPAPSESPEPTESPTPTPAPSPTPAPTESAGE